MIDYYYEFNDKAARDWGMRYGFLRGFHPETDSDQRMTRHSLCWVSSDRVWLENSNGAVLIRDQGRETWAPINHQELAWIKLRARDVEL